MIQAFGPGYGAQQKTVGPREQEEGTKGLVLEFWHVSALPRWEGLKEVITIVHSSVFVKTIGCSIFFFDLPVLVLFCDTDRIEVMEGCHCIQERKGSTLRKQSVLIFVDIHSKS